MFRFYQRSRNYLRDKSIVQSRVIERKVLCKVKYINKIKIIQKHFLKWTRYTVQLWTAKYIKKLESVRRLWKFKIALPRAVKNRQVVCLKMWDVNWSLGSFEASSSEVRKHYILTMEVNMASSYRKCTIHPRIARYAYLKSTWAYKYA